MANQQKYFIGPSLLSDIRSTIQRVDAIAPRTSGPAQDVRLQGLQQPDRARDVLVGKVSDDWPIRTCATVTLWERTGNNCLPTKRSPTQTIENVVNLTQFVPADGWVVIARAPDGKWYLVESEGNPLRIGKTGSQWNKNTTASITLWEGGTPPNETVGGGTIENVVNKWSNVPANTFVGIQRGINGQYYLVVAEC